MQTLGLHALAQAQKLEKTVMNRIIYIIGLIVVVLVVLGVLGLR